MMRPKALTDALDAVTVAHPLPTPETNPAALVVATAALDVDQVTESVTSRLVPLSKDPIAANCCVPPIAAAMIVGVTCRDTRVGVIP